VYPDLVVSETELLTFEVERPRLGFDTDPDPGQALKSQKVELLLYIKKILKVGNTSKSIPRCKNLFERQ
jgi:hypothetical protein